MVSGENEKPSVYESTHLVTVPLKSGIRVTADKMERDRRVKVHHEAVKVVVRPVRECVLKGFVAKTRVLDE